MTIFCNHHHHHQQWQDRQPSSSYETQGLTICGKNSISHGLLHLWSKLSWIGLEVDTKSQTVLLIKLYSRGEWAIIIIVWISPRFSPRSLCYGLTHKIKKEYSESASMYVFYCFTLYFNLVRTCSVTPVFFCFFTSVPFMGKPFGASLWYKKRHSKVLQWV